MEMLGIREGLSGLSRSNNFNVNQTKLTRWITILNLVASDGVKLDVNELTLTVTTKTSFGVHKYKRFVTHSILPSGKIEIDLLNDKERWIAISVDYVVNGSKAPTRDLTAPAGRFYRVVQLFIIPSKLLVNASDSSSPL